MPNSACFRARNRNRVCSFDYDYAHEHDRANLQSPVPYPLLRGSLRIEHTLDINHNRRRPLPAEPGDLDRRGAMPLSCISRGLQEKASVTVSLSQICVIINSVAEKG